MSSAHPSPPVGFRTWLDYAVETMEVRDEQLRRQLDEEPHATREAMIEAARAELRGLRAAAGRLQE